MYTQYQQYIRVAFLRALLQEWLRNRDLPEQFDNPDCRMIEHKTGDYIAFKAVSPVLKVDEKWWLTYLDQDMKSDLNNLIPGCMEYFRSQSLKYSKKQSDLMRKGRQIEDSLADKGFCYPDEQLEYSNIKKESEHVNMMLQNINAVLQCSDWYISSITQNQKYLVFELKS